MDRRQTHPYSRPTRRSFRGAFAAGCLTLWAAASFAQLPPAPPHAGDIEVVRQILLTPESDIDLAKAKLTIDHLIDPGVDVEGAQRQLDDMAKALRAMLPIMASSRLKLDALRHHMYSPSPWNDNRPFRYDLDDPYGASIPNKLLTTYIATRRGNCVSMPMLFVILGQKLGIDVTAATAPRHVFVKYRDDQGKLYNLETTSGAGFTRDVWMRQQHPMSDEALASGIYMRALTNKETVAVMIGTLLELYGQKHMSEQRIAMAKLVLEYNPRDVSAIMHQYSAYLWAMNLIINQYPTLDTIPARRREQAMQLQEMVSAQYAKAYALGWRPPDPAAEEQYRQTIARVRAEQQ